MSYKSALPDQHLQKHFSSWKKAIEQKEICTIICPPFSGREYRISNFIDWLEQKNIRISQIHLTLAQISDPNEVEALFQNSEHDLILSPAEILLNQNTEAMLSAVSHYQQKYQRSALLFFEGTSIDTLQKLPHYLSNKIFQNVQYLPYLESQQTFHFINHLSNRWGLKIPLSTQKEINAYTGGQMWLIKEIVRQLNQKSNSLNELINSEQMKYKTKKIWDTVPRNLKEVITQIANNKRPDISQKSAISELQNLGILSRKNKLIPEFLHEFKFKNPITITFSDSNIFCNNVTVTSLFSKKEQTIIRALLQNSQQRISRPQLAKKIWNSESDYSDWALDKAISRLRKKLVKLGIPKHSLVTIKEFGYQFLLESESNEN